MTNNRLAIDTRQFVKNPPAGISGGPNPENLRYFDIRLGGPSDTPYEGGVFKLELFIPEDYPSTPPKARFLTKIYHPNIDKIGRICLDTLKVNPPEGEGWNSRMTISSVLLSIQGLLADPNPSDPLETSVGQHWNTDKAAAEATAREWTKLYA